MLKWWCHDRKTLASDNWKSARDMVRWVRSSFTLFLTSGRVYVCRAPKEAFNLERLVSRVKHAGGHGLGSNIVVQYSVVPIITLHGRINVRECMERLDNQVHPKIQTLFVNNDAVFQDDNAPIQTAETVLSWFEEHEDELQHLPWPA
jgi:hypothetical protein